MKIASFCANEYPTPPPVDIIYAPMRLHKTISEGLFDRGHDVSMFASSDSKVKTKLVSEKLISFYNNSKWTNLDLPSKVYMINFYYQIILSRLFNLAQQNKFDIIHLHALRGLPYARLVDIPVLITLHSPLTSYERRFQIQEFKDCKNVFYISISQSQRKPLPNLQYADTIYNGIDLKQYRFDSTGGSFLFNFGRIMPGKGTDIAIKIAIKLNLKLKFSGEQNEPEDVYWKSHVKPYINNKNIEYLGMLSQMNVQKYLQKSRLFIFPLQLEESFGLAMIESMACGTPVVAFARGSVPEVIDDGKTGFIINSSEQDKRGDWIIKKTGIEGMIEAVKIINEMPKNDYKIMRRNCRQLVENKFSSDKMISQYEETMKKIIKNYKTTQNK